MKLTICGDFPPSTSLSAYDSIDLAASSIVSPSGLDLVSIIKLYDDRTYDVYLPGFKSVPTSLISSFLNTFIFSLASLSSSSADLFSSSANFSFKNSFLASSLSL